MKYLLNLLTGLCAVKDNEFISLFIHSDGSGHLLDGNEQEIPYSSFNDLDEAEAIIIQMIKEHGMMED